MKKESLKQAVAINDKIEKVDTLSKNLYIVKSIHGNVLLDRVKNEFIDLKLIEDVKAIDAIIKTLVNKAFADCKERLETELERLT